MDIVEKLRGLPIVVTENGRTGMSRMGGALLSEAADEIERLREELLQIKQQSMETHIRAMAHQALHQNEAQILATNTYEAEGRN